MNRISTLSAIVLALSAAACTSLEPNVDMVPVTGYDLVDKTKIDAVVYDKDYAECAAIANQDVNSVGKTASKVVGTAADRVSMGLVGRKAANDADRMTVLKRCLTGRGYNILR
ncbi:MAG: hypothetical protein Q7V20_06365 [Aquabacterium sp.]|uniref:hypothetical protein n=1 Tax=Aquabacterium sp. TaxID=1872578 RepID=UPI002726F7D4|nr:hypothetical protein [Aquabacterium sp.]MDO9003057.1 hypothetical protein [Aquabacterium sp.]